MVGVPGKSKGCSTCRKRKKGCDQKRPICGQCVSSGYVCGGYQRDLTFIAHPTSKAVEKAIFVPIRPVPSAASSPPSPEQAAVVAKCRNRFFEVFMPSSECSCQDEHILQCGHPMNWIELVPHMPNDEVSLDLAFSALSLARVGRSLGDLRLVKESNMFYGRALKNLQTALTDPERRHSDQILATCLLLGYYETFENGGGKSIGWASHIQGAARVMELRGPEAHRTGTAHFLFLGSRTLILYSALLRRKHLFLAERNWLTIPWSLRSFRTSMDYLIDVAVHIPSLLERFDKLQTLEYSDENQSSLLGLLRQCLCTQKALAAWELRRKSTAAPIIVPHRPTMEHDDYPFESDIKFQNHLFFNANLIFWSSDLVLRITITELNTLLIDPPYSHRSSPTQSGSALEHQSREVAIKIAQAIPYGLLPAMGDLGISHITFPMGLVYKFFSRSNDLRVCSWLARLGQQAKHTALNVSRMYENESALNSGEDVEGVEHPYPFGPQLKVESPSPTSWDLSTTSGFSTSDFMGIDHSRSSLSVSDTAARSSESPSVVGLDGVQTHRTMEYVDNDDEPDLSRLSSMQLSDNSRLASHARAATPAHLVEIQRINASMGRFTFVEEDPSDQYIVRTHAHS